MRAGLVKDLNALDKYPWAGHSAILSRRKNPLIPVLEKQKQDPVNLVKKEKSLAEKTIEDVLKHFGKGLKDARRKYRNFVEKGIKHGRREDLRGGGLIRPACHARHENILKEQVIGIVQDMVEEASGR